MTHEWKDFSEESPPLGPPLPLTEDQQAQLVSGVLPSGEGGFFDPLQHQDERGDFKRFTGGIATKGSGINYPFPYPNEKTEDDYAFTSGVKRADFPDQFDEDWWEASGILKTYPAEEATPTDVQAGKVGSGVFHPSGLQNPFSNGPDSRSSGITDFTIFNPYIHHQRLPTTSMTSQEIRIPYISTFRVSIDFNAYGGWLGFNSGFNNEEQS